MDKPGSDKSKLSRNRAGGKDRAESGTFGKTRRPSTLKESKTGGSGPAPKTGPSRGGTSKSSPTKAASSRGNRGEKAGSPAEERKGTSFSREDKGAGFSKEGRGGKFSRGGVKGKPRPVKDPGDDSIRLNKYIASSGICSRREADDLITAGVITVNGKSVTQLGSKIKPGDDVRYNGKRMKTERKVYLVLNKPKDYVTTTDDPKERKTVMMLIEGACPERLYPVGRLDRQTTGVLLFTNDGELAKNLTHPSYNKKKIYQVSLDKAITSTDMKLLAEGVELEDGFIQADGISYISGDSKKEVGLEIHSGRNRIVRRMFEHLGYRVGRLDRVYFAGLTKKNIPRGKWRFLSDKEVSRLKMNAYE